MKGHWLLAGLVAVGLSASVACATDQADRAPESEGALATGPSSADAAAPSGETAAAIAANQEASEPRPGDHIEVPPPPFSDGVYPCSFCHEDLTTNPKRRDVIEDHEDIVLTHDEKNRWCLDCHDSRNRDVLHLASGETIPFEESYRLCGQCHGEKFRDWRAGAHGRRVGYWNGQKGYLLCVHCHSPHSPRFKSMVPKPAPVTPMSLGRSGGSGPADG